MARRDVQEAPLRLGEPQRGSPLSASQATVAAEQGHVSPAGLRVLMTLALAHKHKSDAYAGMCTLQHASASAHCTQSKVHKCIFKRQIFSLFNFQMSSY